jgi:NADH dehydrogenase
MRLGFPGNGEVMMSEADLFAVTGAFGYTGKYITRHLLAQHRRVITLTGHPERPNEFNGRVQAYPFDFEFPERLAERLRGVSTIFNTYWVRFDHGAANYERAIANTMTLIQAAKNAGVNRLVHVSITNPSIDSPLPYFHGKALLESAIQESGLSYTIVRPTVIFGLEDILINNIAYLLRRFPFFVVPGTGEYHLQPIYVEDMARICVQASERRENTLIDAVGPRIFSFNQLVSLIAKIVDSKARIVHLPPGVTLTLARLIGLYTRDVVLTREEITGLSEGLLVSDEAPRGLTRLEDWLCENRDIVGARYASELNRHYRS